MNSTLFVVIWVISNWNATPGVSGEVPGGNQNTWWCHLVLLMILIYLNINIIKNKCLSKQDSYICLPGHECLFLAALKARERERGLHGNAVVVKARITYGMDLQMYPPLPSQTLIKTSWVIEFCFHLTISYCAFMIIQKWMKFCSTGILRNSSDTTATSTKYDYNISEHSKDFTDINTTILPVTQ